MIEDFYEYSKEWKKTLLEFLEDPHLGECIDILEGMCGEIYIHEKTKNYYVCAKIPKKIGNASKEEINIRFLNEQKLQIGFNHEFVNNAYDFQALITYYEEKIPVSCSRYWGGDLAKLIKKSNYSDIEALSIIAYSLAGLRHCYKKGRRRLENPETMI